MIGVLALVAAYKDDSSRPTSKPSVTARLRSSFSVRVLADMVAMVAIGMEQVNDAKLVHTELLQCICTAFSQLIARHQQFGFRSDQLARFAPAQRQ